MAEVIDYRSPTPPKALGPMSPLLAEALGGLGGAIGGIIGYSICPAVFFAVAGVVIGRIVHELAGKRVWLRHGRGGQAAVAASLAVALAALGWWVLTPSDETIFETAFAQPPNAGVGQLEAARYHYGQDWMDLITFTADQKTIDLITSSRAFQTERRELEEYRLGQRPWGEFWRMKFLLPSTRDPAWSAVPPMKDPRLFEWRKDSRDVTLIWDAATGKAYCVSGKT